jgi:long-chain acyl-CoA synthetase
VLRVPVGEVREESYLVADLGLTSIARLELVDQLEREYRLDLDETAIGEQTTVAGLRQLVARRDRIPRQPGLRPWIGWRLARIIRTVAHAVVHRPLLGLVVSLDLVGTEHLDRCTGPVMFISNHVSYLDQPVVMAAFPHRIRSRCATAAWAEFFFTNYRNLPQRIWKRLAFEYCSTACGVFPLPQSSGFRASLQHMGLLVDRGMSLLVFPEGERTQDDSMLPFRPGLAVMVKELEIPVVPVGIVGLGDVLPRGSIWPRRGRVVVRFGLPLELARLPAGEIVPAAEEAMKRLLAGEGVRGS